MFVPSTAVQRVANISKRPTLRPGPDVISLSSGDPDFETPAYIQQALCDAIAAGYTHYTDNQGDPELRGAIADSLSHQSDKAWTPAEIVVTHGGSGALAAAIMATVNPGDRVLLPEPTYSLYADLVRLVDAEPVYVRQTADFHLDLDAIREAAPSAKLLVLCHPNNPTGVVYRRDELEAIAEIAETHDLLVLADEAYDHIVYPGVAFTSTLAIPGLRARLLYCQTFAKTYAMTGWRIGFLAAPPEVAAAVARMHRTFNGTMNAAVQRAALVALTHASDGPAERCAEFTRRRQFAIDRLSAIDGISVNSPDGAFYLFVRSLTGLTSDEMVAGAAEFGVAIRGGNEYGPSGEGFIRIAFSSSPADIEHGLDRLALMFPALASFKARMPAQVAG